MNDYVNNDVDDRESSAAAVATATAANVARRTEALEAAYERLLNAFGAAAAATERGAAVLLSGLRTFINTEMTDPNDVDGAAAVTALVAALDDLLERSTESSVRRLEQGRTAIITIAATTDSWTEVLLESLEEMHDVTARAASGVFPGGGGPPPAEEPGRGDTTTATGNDDDDPTPRNPEVDEIDAYGFRDAVRYLQDVNDRRPVGYFSVYEMSPLQDGEEEHDAVEFEDDGAVSFGRFVTLLGLATHEGGGGRAIRDLDIQAYWCSRLPHDDIERLFRDVLPGHPTLQEIRLGIGHLPSTCLKTEAIPTEAGTWPLSNLHLSADEDGKETYPDEFEGNVQAIADMLNRNAAISKLELKLDLDSDHCRRICQALSHNTSVYQLSLTLGDIFADTLDGVTEALSLRQLFVRGYFSDAEALASLARQLRTNETLGDVSIARGYAADDNAYDDQHVLLDLVRTYNYTLRRLRVSLGSDQDNALFQEHVDAILLRNERIRNVLQGLQDPDRDVPPQVLGRLLSLVSTFPTLLRRFLKRYYVNVVTDRLLARGVGGGTGGRGRGRRRPRAPDF